MNCNVTIETQDIHIGRRIAHSIRASTAGGLPGLQSMAFAHEGNIEIACNVESITKEHFDQYRNQPNAVSVEVIESFGNYCYVSPNTIKNRVQDLARECDIKTNKQISVRTHT